jgi:hypothetical protein
MVKTSSPYTGDLGFKFGMPEAGYPGFYVSFQIRKGIAVQNRPGALPPTESPTHHSLFILLF